MRRISVKGVLIGAIVDVVTSGIAGVPLIIYIIMHRGITEQRGVIALVHADWTLRSINLSLGLACSVLGGYVAGRIANHDEVLNGALSSFLCILLGIYSAASGNSLESPAEHALLLAASLGAAAFGGYLARKSRRVSVA